MTYAEYAAPQWAAKRCHHMSGEPGEGPAGRRHGGHRGRGFGGPGPRFPGGPGPRFAGGPAFGGGRGRRRRGDVRLALLRLLSEEPRNGYQLMQAIDERSGGRWSPSPGSVYPALSLLEDEGLIRSAERDGAKVFELTEQGTEHVAGLGDAPAPWEQEGGPGEDALHELHALARQVMMAVRQVAHAADEGQLDRARTILKDTRRAIYRVLADEDTE